MSLRAAARLLSTRRTAPPTVFTKIADVAHKTVVVGLLGFTAWGIYICGDGFYHLYKYKMAQLAKLEAEYNERHANDPPPDEGSSK